MARTLLENCPGGNLVRNARFRHCIRVIAPGVLALACALVTACVSIPGATRPGESGADGQNGRLVIVGGGLRGSNEAVYRTILDGRDGDAPLCVVPTASAGDPQRTIARAVAVFDEWGGPGTATGIPLSTESAETADDPLVAAQIRGCSGFYFTGGVQSRITAVFRPRGRSTPAYDALMWRFREGAVVAGSSAGAAIMSDPMIGGGSTTGALEHGIHRAAAESDEDDGATPGRGVSIMPGLGLFSAAIVDQHFLARGRIGRLITAVLDVEEFDLGFGIDENTALVVVGSTVTVAGASAVVIIDARHATRDGRSATDVKLHLIAPGDRFDVDSRRVMPGDGNTLPASSDTVDVPDDVLARWAFLHVLHQFARSPEQQLALSVPGGRLILRKGPDFTATAGAGTGVQDLPAALSITGLRLDVVRTATETTSAGESPVQRASGIFHW